MEIYLARTQGFCAGVAFAITIVDEALKKYGAPLHVYHEIVHNTYVVDSFRTKGVVFVERVDAVPVGARLIFSAHGVPPAVIEQAQARRLVTIDATCPLVKKVHQEAFRFSSKGYHVILIGHRKHQEVIGTAGYVAGSLLHVVESIADIDALSIPEGADVAYITQTTLSVDETADMIARLIQRFPRLIAPPHSDLCYATQTRQDAVKELASICDVVVICGSPNSSNSNRLCETGSRAGVATFIVDRAEQLDMAVLNGKTKIGISSGASVPQCIVDHVVSRIQEEFLDTVVHTLPNLEKDIVFSLPVI